MQVCAGTVLAAHGKFEEALALLAKHQGNLEAVALVVQIHLMQNRTDLALKEVQAAKRWAQDNLLINLAESWVGLRVVSTALANSFFVPLSLSFRRKNIYVLHKEKLTLTFLPGR